MLGTVGNWSFSVQLQGRGEQQKNRERHNFRNTENHSFGFNFRNIGNQNDTLLGVKTDRNTLHTVKGERR